MLYMIHTLWDFTFSRVETQIPALRLTVFIPGESVAMRVIYVS